jgi:cytoskeletal protein RodZ
MNIAIRRVWRTGLVGILSIATAAFAEPFQQNSQDSTSPPQVADEHKAQGLPSASVTSNSASVPSSRELPDAPTPAQSSQQNQQDSIQPQNPNSVPSGAAGAKAPTVRGAPASRPIGAAIAPTKQKQRRSLIIKAGLIAGACVAVGSVVALSRSSPSRPPGAP